MSYMTEFDSENWSLDEGDSSVGIFGEEFVHETCPHEYDQGVHVDTVILKTWEESFSQEQWVLTCLDCGATHMFLHHYQEPSEEDD